MRASIEYSARPVAACCVLRRRRALSAARGPTLPSIPHMLPSLPSSSASRGEGRQYNRYPPSPSLFTALPLQLLLWSAAPCSSFINTALDAGFILLSTLNASTRVLHSICRGYFVFFEAPAIRHVCLIGFCCVFIHTYAYYDLVVPYFPN